MVTHGASEAVVHGRAARHPHGEGTDWWRRKGRAATTGLAAAHMGPIWVKGPRLFLFDGPFNR
jgi:hypothetical protein